jgi:hypothetical protein
MIIKIIFFSLSVMSHAYAGWEIESKKIDHLLAAVKESGATFIRNGKEYNSVEASDHLRMKLKKAQSSWFAPKKEKWTAKMFIDEVASKSSMSGEDYLIKEKDKPAVKAADWLNERLAALNK